MIGWATGTLLGRTAAIGAIDLAKCFHRIDSSVTIIVLGEYVEVVAQCAGTLGAILGLLLFPK